MVDTPIPVKKSASPNWYMKGKGAGSLEDPSEAYVIDSAVGSALGATTDAAASVSADEDTTAKSLVSLLKGAKNLLIDTVGHLATLAGCIADGSLSIHWGEHLDYLASDDNVGIAAIEKGAVTTAHSAITDTATSAEIDCRSYNSAIVHFVLNTTDVTWTFGVQGAVGSGLTFVNHLDTAGAVVVYTTDNSGWFMLTGIPDYTKIVATKVDVGASTCTCNVIPFNV